MPSPAGVPLADQFIGALLESLAHLGTETTGGEPATITVEELAML